MSRMRAKGNLTRPVIAFIKAIAHTFYMSLDFFFLTFFQDLL